RGGLGQSAGTSRCPGWPRPPGGLARFGGSTSGESRASIQAAASVTAEPDSPKAGIAIDGSEPRFGVEFWPHNRCTAPLPTDLSRLIPGHVTMQTKDRHDDGLRHHGIVAGRPDLAERCIWQLWMLTKD